VSSNMFGPDVLLLADAYPEAGVIYFAADSMMMHDTGEPEMSYMPRRLADLFFRPHSRGLMFATNEKLQLQTFYQTGYLPALAYHTFEPIRNMSGMYNPSTAAGILMIGRPYMEPAHSNFGLLFQRYFEGIKDEAVNEFVFTQINQHIKYEQFSSFLAVVFLPWHLHPVTFMHFYAVAVPLLVPSARLMFTLEANLHFFTQDVRMHYPGWHGHRMFMDIEEALPSPLWDRTARGLSTNQFLFWWDVSPMRQRPGVLFFESCADLLSQLASMDHRKISLEMQDAYAKYVQHNREVLSEGLQFLGLEIRPE